MSNRQYGWFSNVFRHYVLDLWVVAWRKHHAVGEVIIVRYADDFVLGFREETDAKRCLGALKERFAKFGLASKCVSGVVSTPRDPRQR